jgi:hypothetical protein
MGRGARLAAVMRAAAMVMAPTAAMAGAKQFTASGYQLPADKPVTIVLMRPDVQVGQLQAGGAIEPNADWTKQGRDNLSAAMQAHNQALHLQMITMADAEGPTGKLVADYEALHRAVATAIMTHKYGGPKLPTKKDRFDWTLGSGAQALATASGANYALFFVGRDNFASGGRKAMQVAGALGCLVGFCMITSGGQHIYYASLVELSTGNVVWFNVQRGSKGDIREADGARGMVDAVLESLPTRPGQGPVQTASTTPR